MKQLFLRIIVATLPFFAVASAFPPSSSKAANRNALKRRQILSPLIKCPSLQVRGGASMVTSVTPIPSAPSTTLHSATGTLNVGDVSNRQKYIRNAKELFKHVWPSLPRTKEVKGDDPSASTAIQRERKYALGIRFRVILSIILMLLGKLTTIATPFLFKMLIDTVPKYSGYASGGAASSVASAAVAPSQFFVARKLPISLPLLLLFSYGLCRSLSSFFRESTTAIFSHVAQSAIRSVGRSTFDHVHSLDLQYHLNRNTGALSRILERGSRSISFALNAMVFNTVPTLLEVAVVAALMFRKFGIGHSLTVLMTIFIYSAFTIFVTQWRSSIRKDMNALENKASGKISDSLLNYETVKYFNLFRSW